MPFELSAKLYSILDPIPFVEPLKKKIHDQFNQSKIGITERMYLRDTAPKPLRISKAPPHVDRVYLTDHETLIEEIVSKKTDVAIEGVIQREDIEAFERTQRDLRKKKVEEVELIEIFEAPVVEAERIQTDSGRRFDASEIIPLLLNKAFSESPGDITSEEDNSLSEDDSLEAEIEN